MLYLNSVTLIGNLTRSPEIKSLPSGMAVVNFSIATNRTWKDKDGIKQESVEFHNIVAFGKTAEIINNYVKKGDQIFVQGRLQTQSWEKDNVKHYRTEVIVDTFQFGQNKREDGQTQTRSNTPDPKTAIDPKAEQELMGNTIQYPTEEIDNSSIPF